MSHLLHPHVDPAPPPTATFDSAGLRTRAAHLQDRFTASVTHLWFRVRHADTSTVMLVLVLLVALLLLLGMAFTSVNRRH